MRANIAIDDELIDEALAVTGIKTRRELVATALRELIRARRQKNMLDLAGKIELRQDYDHKKLRGARHGPD